MRTAGFLFGAVAVLVLVLPVAYQTNDDPQISQILLGDQLLGTQPDAHCIFINSGLGWIVSRMSGIWPDLNWYGLLIAALYALAYVVVGLSLTGDDRGKKGSGRDAAVHSGGMLPADCQSGLLGCRSSVPCTRVHGALTDGGAGDGEFGAANRMGMDAAQ
jgi:hypothetical protein